MRCNKYDAGEIIAEIRREKALNTFWAVWPLGCYFMTTAAALTLYGALIYLMARAL